MKSYTIKRFSNINNIDWSSVPFAEINEVGWTVDLGFHNAAQMVFIDGYGFVVRIMTDEKEPWANCLVDNGPVWLDSCLEAFLMFNEEGYINFETNCLGKRLQFLGPNRDDRHTIIDLDYKVIAEKNSDGWSVTIYIPLDKLSKTYQNLDVSSIGSGFAFRGNFYKTGTNPVTKEEHYYMWNRINTPNPDFHQPSQFGLLIIK